MEISIGRVIRKTKFCSTTCPTCKQLLDFVIDLEQEMSYMEFEKKILIPLESMRAVLYKCPRCNIHYLELEEDDYDYFVLRKVKITNDRLNAISINNKRRCKK